MERRGLWKGKKERNKDQKENDILIQLSKKFSLSLYAKQTLLMRYKNANHTQLPTFPYRMKIQIQTRAVLPFEHACCRVVFFFYVILRGRGTTHKHKPHPRVGSQLRSFLAVQQHTILKTFPQICLPKCGSCWRILPKANNPDKIENAPKQILQ